MNKTTANASTTCPSRGGSLYTLMSAVVLSLTGLVSSALGGDWPQWRGPGGEGHAEGKGYPVVWSEGSNVTWRVALPGRGWSSPVIEGDRVWLTTAMETPAKPEEAARSQKLAGGDQALNFAEAVEFRALAVELHSGRLVLDRSLFSQKEPDGVHPLNSFASPTPVVHEGRLYASFGSFGTACVETRSGNVLWTQQSLKIQHENGPGSSPIFWKHLLIFHLDGSDTQSIVALEAASGKVAWQTARSGEMPSHPQLKKSYATPLVVRIQGRDQLVSQGSDCVYGYDPESGKELWKVKYGVQGFSLSARPVAGHGLVFMSTGFMRPEMLALRYDQSATPEIAWRSPKGAPTMPSPLLVGDDLYFVNDNGGMLSCLDAKTGKEQFRERLGGNYNASPILADGRIYLFSREGLTTVIEPGKEFKLLAKNQLPGKIMATPAAADGAFILRTDQALFRIETKRSGL